MFIKQRPFKLHTTCACQWCGKRGKRTLCFKLIDGPVQIWFCNDEHALDWLDNRHHSVAVNKFLRLGPVEKARVLKGQNVASYVESLKDRAAQDV